MSNLTAKTQLKRQMRDAKKRLRELPKWMRDLMRWEGTGPFMWRNRP